MMENGEQSVMIQAKKGNSINIFLIEEEPKNV
jgi:hypothetical protein